MGWFKKKEERLDGKMPDVSDFDSSLPELPKLPELPRFDDFDKKDLKKPNLPEIKALPSFSNSDFGLDFSQEAVKSAILPDKESKKRTLEIPEEKNKEAEPLPLLAQKPLFSEERYSKKIEPVYIRIDKFKTAIQGFQETQKRVAEIESLLKNIKETKQKEDEELRKWERELETMKARIDSIDNGIFSKLD